MQIVIKKGRLFQFPSYIILKMLPLQLVENVRYLSCKWGKSGRHKYPEVYILYLNWIL